METPLTKYLYCVAEAMKLLSMSRTAIYEEMRNGRLHFVKRGRSTLIPAESIESYVRLLINETEGVLNGQAA